MTLPASTRPKTSRHHDSLCLEKRGVERGSARRSSLKGRQRAIVNQTNTGTATSERRGGARNYGLFRGHRYHLELN